MNRQEIDKNQDNNLIIGLQNVLPQSQRDKTVHLSSCREALHQQGHVHTARFRSDNRNETYFSELCVQNTIKE